MIPYTLSLWPKRPLVWTDNGRVNISVVFTWHLPEIRRYCAALAEKAIVGGPAIKMMPDYLSDVAEIGGELPGVLQRHNALATRTTVGCPNHCSFCGVPEIEGDFRELEDWPDLPIVCDNNLLAASRKHFDRVIDRLKRHKGIDFNQGLDARLLDRRHAYALSGLVGVFRLAWDSPAQEAPVLRAVALLTGAGIPLSRLRCYVLVGYHDTPEESHYRMNTLVRAGILPNPQRYVPLNSLTGSYAGPGWTNRELRRLCRYYARESLYAIRRGSFRIPFEEFV